jgi:hypothetical protein
MNAVQNRVSETRKSWSERIKTWLGTTSRRPAMKNTFKPRLENLEERDVPSTLAGDINQIQTDLRNTAPYVSNVMGYDQQIVNDVNNLAQAYQQGQSNSTIVGYINQLQSDMTAESQSYGGYYYGFSSNPAMWRDVEALVNDSYYLPTYTPVSTSTNQYSPLTPSNPLYNVLANPDGGWAGGFDFGYSTISGLSPYNPSYGIW